MTTSKRVSVTFSDPEFAELSQTAQEKDIPVAVLIRERLEQWQQMQTAQAESAPLQTSDPRLDVILNLLQPLERRLQRLDEHELVIQEISSTLLSESREHDFGVKSLLQQILREDIPAQSVDVVERSLFLQRMERLELYAEALYKHIEQIGLDVAPPEANQQANNEHIRAQLDDYLAAKQ
jgi:hypothetical protein